MGICNFDVLKGLWKSGGNIARMRRVLSIESGGISRIGWGMTGIHAISALFQQIAGMHSNNALPAQCLALWLRKNCSMLHPRLGSFMAAWHLMASGSVEITTWFNEVLHTKISRHTKSSRQTRTDLSTQICKQDSLFIFIPWRCESLCAPFCTCVEVQWNCFVHKGIANQSE